MVTDGETRKVHYYSGPDGKAIPRVKQLLRQDWYFEELSARNRNEASPLWKSLMPLRPPPTKVDPISWVRGSGCLPSRTRR